MYTHGSSWLGYNPVAFPVFLAGPTVDNADSHDQSPSNNTGACRLVFYFGAPSKSMPWPLG